jgi:hypothetical protein
VWGFGLLGQNLGYGQVETLISSFQVVYSINSAEIPCQFILDVLFNKSSQIVITSMLGS